MKQPPSSATPSPCVSICRMDDGTGWCTGCLRTLDEIASWSLLDDAGKRGVWLELSRRRLAWRRLQKAESSGSAGREDRDGLDGRDGQSA